MTTYFTVVHKFDSDDELQEYFKENISPNILPHGGNISRWYDGDAVSELIDWTEGEGLKTHE